MSQIPNENDDDKSSVAGSDFVQIDQPNGMQDQEAEAKQHDPLDWVIDTETTTIKELKWMMANLEAKNQMLQGKVETLELKAENRASKLKENAEQGNESSQHQQTKEIPYDVQLIKPDNETQFGFKIGTIENHHYITAIEPGSVAMRTGHLHDYVSLIAINGTRVDSMTHQEVVQFVRAAGNRLTITIDPNYRIENGVRVSGGDSLNSSTLHNNYARLEPKSHIVTVDEADEIYGTRKSQRGSANMHLIWIPCILLAILCGMYLYNNFSSANSTQQAPMAGQSDAVPDRIGQIMGVVDGLKALIKSQNETITELSAKNGQQAKEIGQMIKEGNAHKELEKLHIQTIETLRAKIDNIEKEHSRTIDQKSVHAGENEKKNNGQKAETVDLLRVCMIVIFLFTAVILFLWLYIPQIQRMQF